MTTMFRASRQAEDRRSFLDVGLTVGGGNSGLSDETGDHDDPGDVGRYQEELRGDWRLQNSELALE